MNAGRDYPDVASIRQLPAFASTVISKQWEDMNGHVNVAFYMSLYNEAGWPMFDLIGVDPGYFEQRQMGIVDLEHHIWYLSELHVGDRVTIHGRFLDHDAKRIHGIVFTVNDETSELANALEFLAISMDLRNRRAAEIPADVAARLADVTKAHRQFGWTFPTRLSIPG